MSKKTGNYSLTNSLISSWKTRAKKIKLNLKDLAKDSGISPQHMTRIVRGKVPNPRLQTISDVEMMLRSAEKKAGV
ncbi:MAG: helix-turn-helix domain-containing protein [Rickettsiales bacterium]|nr:helix-turn-helix domain-containing protein [Rickettsiales bacterium]